MKKIFSVLVILCWLTLPARPQAPKGAWQGQLEAMKTTFITTRLQLTPQEAEKFWPIYNQYDAEVHQALYDFHRAPNANELDLEQTMLNIRKKYAIEFHKAIPPPKINEFFKAERDFNRLVQAELNRRKRYPVGPPPRPKTRP
jgi:hypothetical protein